MAEEGITISRYDHHPDLWQLLAGRQLWMSPIPCKVLLSGE